ncbi:uncharacterized protein LOC122849201 [Aphidius gifuensis]|uniref:uncharacterized protein LOC122849201 n=1 Tax=Aphidius gifuensis TaxID=684658 RepID=UPI001CDB939C|nr:uncharacterized protein LOC122849201 [Aphidius gifuensis]
MSVEAGIFPERIKKTNYSCSVKDCISRAEKNFNLRFHMFPKPNKYIIKNKNLETVDRFLVWKNLLKITKVTNYTRVCSLHFSKCDYILPDIRSSQKQLKKTAIPTCNLPDPVMLNEFINVQQLSSNSSSPVDKSSSFPENDDEELSLNSPRHPDSPSLDGNIDQINSPHCSNDVIDLSVKLNCTDITDQDCEYQNTPN